MGAVDEGGDFAAGVDGEEFGGALLGVREVDFAFFEGDVEEGGEEADFVAVARFGVGVEGGGVWRGGKGRHGGWMLDGRFCNCKVLVVTDIDRWAEARW